MRKIFKWLLLVWLILIAVGCTSQPLKRVPYTYRPMVQLALQKAGNNRLTLEKFLNKCPDEQMEGAAFLLSYMPERDVTNLKAPFLIENIKYAYLARRHVKWGKQIPDSLFLNYVLPYANIHERRDNWRKDFYQKFFPLIKNAQRPGQAAIILNRNIWNMIHVHYSTKRPKADQSPYESIKAGLASCTGLSILLVDACRAVDIPARLTGVPMWYNNSGNHSWVEIWDRGWHFLESASNDTLDHAWFQENAGHANHSNWQYGIYALSFKKTERRYHDIFNPNVNYLWDIDVTDRYAHKVKLNE